jgi:hypothetical protein
MCRTCRTYSAESQSKSLPEISQILSKSLTWFADLSHGTLISTPDSRPKKLLCQATHRLKMKNILSTKNRKGLKAQCFDVEMIENKYYLDCEILSCANLENSAKIA